MAFMNPILSGDASTSHRISMTFNDNQGISEDDKENYSAIREAYSWGSICNIRNLFAAMLLSRSLSQPEKVSSLRNFNGMPIPGAILSTHIENNLLNEFGYDKRELTYEHTFLISSMTMEQMSVYDEIMESVAMDRGGVFFIYGHAGTGKTFILKALCAALRSRGDIVLPVASSGIAAAYLSGGKTAHEVFGIPLDISENSTCKNIKHGCHMANHLCKTKLIIWDEAPMIHKFCIEALDRSLRDVMQTSEKPFGGKLVVFAGDFRQLLPLYTKGGRDKIVGSIINSSYLWSECKVLHLTRNIRLDLGSFDIKDQELREFDEWIKKVGEGAIGGVTGEKNFLHIPDDVLIKDTTEHLISIVKSTYASLENNLCNPDYFQERAILAPTPTIVDSVNQYIMSLLPGKGKVYRSCDQLQREENKTETRSIKFLNTLNCLGLPRNAIWLKVGAIVMLLKTIDHSVGMCHGTRLMVTDLGNYVIRATIISGSNIGGQVYIPRISMTPSSASNFPMKFERKQFPLAISFAMTIHKAQGQSLSHVGLYLPIPVFNHGQLYLAISRVNNKNGLKILISDQKGVISNATANVVFKEIFQNL
ncbi:uncharacterized protein LOC141651236 [Silene latifolia]|uniref:uncharacterized protein LOC141651236 n=1 Tax=Silene latifolia TaxID=37657 RepID=UPI003D7810C3